MRKIVPITDLQRQAGQLVSEVVSSDEPIIITQRGRAAALIVSAARYAQIEADLQRLDELELLELVARARVEIAAGQTLAQQQVKARLAKRAGATTSKTTSKKRRAR